MIERSFLWKLKTNGKETDLENFALAMEVIETLKEVHLREMHRVSFGRGPVTQEWADKIGADGYGRSAVQAVEIVKKLLRQKG